MKMRCKGLVFFLYGLLLVPPAGAAIVTMEEFHAAQANTQSPLVLAPRLTDVQPRPTVLLDAALFNVVQHEVAKESFSRNVALVPKGNRSRPRSVLQLGSAAVSQGAVYAHSMVGLFELLGSDAWRDVPPGISAMEEAGVTVQGGDVRESAPAGTSSRLAVSIYTILAATAFAASPFYLALGSMAAESLLAAPVAPMPPFAVFVAAGILGMVLIGKRRR
jgi:hypothetical protein